MKIIYYDDNVVKNIFTQHNGDYKYLINIDNNIIKIYKRTIENYVVDNDPRDYDTLIKTYKKWDCVILGIDNAKKLYGPNYKFKLDGNSVLIEKSKGNYVFVGFQIYEFNIKDNIIEYYSPTGNSFVPYPYAIGEKNTYLMLDSVYINNKDRITQDPYEQYLNLKNKFKIPYSGEFNIKLIDGR